MKNKIKYLFVLHIVLVVYSFMGIFSKFAAAEEFLSIKFMVFYGIALFGLFIYAIVWQLLLKHMPLFTAYANKAVTVIWGIIWGRWFFGEEITVKKTIGAIVIVLGVYIVVSADYKQGFEKEAEHD